MSQPLPAHAVHPPALTQRVARLALPCALALACSTGWAASGITDPAGDLLPGFLSGSAYRADLDIVGVSAVYNVTLDTFTLTGTMAGPLRHGVSTFGFYTFGVDTGSGTPLFASLGLTGIYADSLVVLDSYEDGTAVAIRSTVTPLPAGTLTMSGNTISATFATSFLPSTGYAPNKYLWSFWTRNASGEIADFGPDNASFTAATVPEPHTLWMLGAGLAGLAALRRWRHPMA